MTDHDAEYTDGDGVRYIVDFKSYAEQGEHADTQLKVYEEWLRSLGFVESQPGCYTLEVDDD